MADIVTGKIENDKEKSIIDEMSDDIPKTECATLPDTAAQKEKNFNDSNVTEDCTDEDPSSGFSKGDKDAKDSVEEFMQSQIATQQICNVGIETINKEQEQSQNSETEKSKGPDTEILDITKGPSKGPDTEILEKTKGPDEVTDNIRGPSDEIFSKTGETSTELVDETVLSSAEVADESEKSSAEIIDKTREASSEIADKDGGPCTEITDEIMETNTKIHVRDETEVCGTEMTHQVDSIAESTQKTEEDLNTALQSEDTEQTPITKELLPEQDPLICTTSGIGSNEKENQQEELNTTDIEMTDQSELKHHAAEAAGCEEETLNVSQNIPEPNCNQSKTDNGTDKQDDLVNSKNSNLVDETLKRASSDSSLGSKKENNVNETGPNYKSALISTDSLQLPMEVDDESIQSENAMYDTPGPATPASSIADTGSVSVGPTPSKRSRQNSTGSSANVEAVSDEIEHHTFPASKVFEYQWPKDSSGEYYMLQEQISEFLGVKSFKRKYPELQRRPVEMNERMFLREKGAVTETQCDLGLTAIRSDEVYDLMHRDYPDKYAEYAAVLHERERQTIKEKHKDYEVPKLEKSKMTEYIKKAMKSASEWNTIFLRERKEERRAYFDLQTFNVHYPAGRYKVLPPDLTSPSPYPVTLIPGQYQDYYKNHSPEELKYLPLNTALFNPPKQLGNSLANPQEVLSEDASEEDVEAGGGSDSDSDDDSSSGESDDSSGQDSGQMVEDLAKGDKGDDDLMCRMCEKQGETDEDMVQCSECKKFGHPTCLDLTVEMVTVIKTYPWQCMECKTCVECMDPYDEDKMIFCDRCDRGYHTFCVGLRSIPNGQWKCRSCKSPDTPRTPKSSSKIRGRGRKRGNNTPAKEG
ncbi:PHD finger protein 10-like [Pecten maximus]|uniref:PHD finger protein 10-like n=1 Tax=Pecten maximus TaxID=6579 RepID=UPI001458D9EC|nr:PHD finger protein 10-like [Pecten maximus]